MTMRPPDPLAAAPAQVPVRLERLPVAGGRCFGVATLDAPAALHALNAGMAHRLRYALLDWAGDPRVAGVLLKASGDRAFCAGGDMRRLHDALRHGDGLAYAREFFATEYALDYLIHTFPKPVLCWGHGIVMGGGLGLMAGASHRVVTPSSRLAMPELHIGLFPDAGGTWFLRHMPGRSGLFLALTGASLGADDAVFGGLADCIVPHERLDDVCDAIAASSWSGDRGQDDAWLHDLLAAHGVPPEHGPLRRHYDTIQQATAGARLDDVAARLCALDGGDPWLQAAADGCRRGAPSALWAAWEMQRRTAHASLAQVLRLEYRVALARCAHPDLVEGIRAVLVDKDRRPRWQPDTLAALDSAGLATTHFAAAEPIPATLADTGADA